ncbi:hypothetical protein M441DRAFT_37416 [Trichoderma asperellum CBS 433.97]|uniref:Uncharacterized protein n=1 Tax=Trichoderma asperellum (strain ATCC 204424 / CBS 433.97 / NBRC 101777) TaxID=1042311 RepID=A0A2T3Z7S7_TRIA4|nr:hypothetical protein M441DRAFT_37416 [Trichoderma asperellum CBS 433.97]PTB40835.1 hypothetical protein M441DRAFT_37416 [Trichoderma asperellum CBS 433.97]
MRCDLPDRPFSSTTGKYEYDHQSQCRLISPAPTPFFFSFFPFLFLFYYICNGDQASDLYTRSILGMSFIWLLKLYQLDGMVLV